MTSIIVVGSGVAGMTAALEAVGTYDVTLLTKADLAQSNTRYAQGGVAVVIDEMSDPGAPKLGDTVESHVADTMVAGAGISDEETVRILCDEGPEAIDELIARGVAFDRHDGELSHGLEAAHAYARILHAGGDATGAGIAYALIDRIRESDVTVREQTTVVDLVIDSGTVRRGQAPRRRGAQGRRRDPRDRGSGPAVPLHDQPRGGDRRRTRYGPASRRRRGRSGVLPVPPHVAGRTGQLLGVRGRAR